MEKVRITQIAHLLSVQFLEYLQRKPQIMPRLLLHAYLATVGILSQVTAAEPVRHDHVSFNGPFEVEANGVQNINIIFNNALDGELTIAYGACDLQNPERAHHRVGRTHVGAHPMAKRHVDWEAHRPTKFVWAVPEDVDAGCLHAFVDSGLVGRSPKFAVKKRVTRRSASFADVADPMGPWFDGVEYLKQKQPNETFVSATKERKFGILGAGISSLLTAVSASVLSCPTRTDIYPVDSRLCRHPRLENPRVFQPPRWPYDDFVPQQLSA